MTTQPFGGGGVDIITVGGTDNYVMTAVDADTIQGEQYLTFDGSTLTVTGAITGVTSIFQADVKIGEDDETKIDFETADEIHLYAANVEQVYVADNIFGPQSDSDVDLGTTAVRWKDAYIDTITTTGTITTGDSVQTATIDFTDGDLAMTIADGGSVTFAQDTFHSNGTGVVVGDTAQRTITGQVPEFQIAGTTGADATLTIGRWSASAGGGGLHFFKSRASTIGTLHADSRVDTAGDTIGNIVFTIDDGSTSSETNAYNHYAARISGQLDAATSGANDAPGRLVFYTTASGGITESEAMRIGNNGMMTYGGGVSRDTGIIFDNAGTDYHVGVESGDDEFIIGFGAVLGTTPIMTMGAIGNGRVTIGKQQETTTHGLLYLNPDTVTVGANKPYHYLYMSNNNVITIPSGTASLVTAMNIEAPNITATGTVTTTATIRIGGAMTEGTTDYALLVAAGLSRFDGISVHYDGVQLGWNNSNSGEDLLCYGDASGSYMWWDASSNLLNIKHNTAGTTVTVMQFIDSDSAIVGSITTNSTGNSTAFNTSSDYRLKENEAPIADGLQRLRELKPYTFNWKKNPDFRQDGFFAHEVADVVPIATAGEKDGEEYQAIDHSKLIPLLTAAIQALDEKVTALGG